MNYKAIIIEMKRYIIILLVLSIVISGHSKNRDTQQKNNKNMHTEVPKISDFPIGNENTGYAQYFSGKSWLASLTGNSALNVPISNVTFEPGCRNNWHSHTGGQILIAVGGVGYYQERGKDAIRMVSGDVVEIAPNIEHWHGAAPGSWFSHLAITCNPQTNENKWLEPVSDSDYAKASNDEQTMEKHLTQAQQKIVTIAANTAIGNLDALKIELAAGLDAGLTINQIKEILIQMYAYAGFPRSLQGINTFMAVLNNRQEKGIHDTEGSEATPITDTRDKYTRGREILETLTRMDQTKITGPNAFAPAIDTFLKEHLFADIFERDLLTYAERELATISALAAMPGVEPMLQSHMNMGINTGLTLQQLEQVTSIIFQTISRQQGEIANKILTAVSTEKTP